ncbi:Alpha/Beta hydrolase protein [Lophiotrema nucula]|uniref:Alpha/Beta hydrolase protein n=1 Tax=Lophiotrema nucula TaxID=690887 RepID=A0A6A5ZT18_9PLEO|nr:Alpha/Beta hydrolase protein [Lophiotrema nucula]
MAYQGFPDNAITVSIKPGIRYTSVFFPKLAESPKPSILFLHGFPSSSWDWHNQIKYFSAKGYGVIAPDLLGYGGTTAPQELEPYAFRNMADDIIALLKHCNIDLDGGEKVHVVGHDFGSIFMGTLLGYYPNIALTASFLAVPYTQPGVKLDMDAMKAITEKVLGFELFGYRRFLMRDDSWDILGAHRESFFYLTYAHEDLMISDFLPPDKLETWITEFRIAPTEPWMTEAFKAVRDKIFSAPDAYRGPTNWYRARFQDFLGIDEEKRDIGESPRIPCPAMFLQSGSSKMLMPEVKERTAKFADEYEYLEAPSGEGHFVQLEAPDEVNDLLEKYLLKHAP